MRWLALPVVALLCACLVSAQSQPTQQYSKILIQPLYRESMASGTNYSYNVTVVPPDRINSVVSAVVSFNAQINGQTQNFTLWVNNQSCKNPSYFVSTAFSATGNIQFYFDCSNVITATGNYTLTLKSSVNTGVVSGWIDLTYMNDPRGTASVSGTEYSPGDPATIFLQLLDAQGDPVNSGNCFVDIYYPLSGGVHPYTVRDAPMVFATGDDGIYFYDLVAPSTLGVYMLSAKCSYAYNWQWVYPSTEEFYFPVRTAGASNTGVLSGSALVLNTPSDTQYVKCQTSGSGTCQEIYVFNSSQYGNFTNVTNINLYYLGESTGVQTLYFAYLDASGSYVNLSNTLVFVAAGSTTVPSGVDQLQTNSVPVSAVVNGVVTIRTTIVYTGTQAVYHNWLTLAFLTNYGTVQDVKGNSEMHITNLANATMNSLLPAIVSVNMTVNQINTTTTQINTTMNQVNTTVNAYTAVLSQMNSTINQINTTVTQVNVTVTASASLISQVWTWVQSIFGWTQSSAAADQSVAFVAAQYYADQESAVVAQVLVNGTGISTAACSLQIYLPNMTGLVSTSMSYAGTDGLYSYLWTPSGYGSYPARVNCTGGGIVSQVSAAASLGVSSPMNGVMMQMVS